MSVLNMENDKVPCTDFGFAKDFSEHYTMGELLGRDQLRYGYYNATSKGNGDRAAVKRFEKSKMVLSVEVEYVKREVEILKALSVSGHENVVKFYNAFEDEDYVYIVMEFCEGGNLLDRIISKADCRFSEEDALVIVRHMLKIAEDCHLQGIVHRDMKPENFLFESAELDSSLKAIEFGLSDFIKPGKRFNEVVGTTYYVAPEVLKRSSGPESDLWGIGVTTYILLCGSKPFWDQTEHGTYREILKSEPDFLREPWSTISEDAKDLIKNLLKKDPRERLTATQALSHVWVKEGENAN